MPVGGWLTGWVLGGWVDLRGWPAAAGGAVPVSVRSPPPFKYAVPPALPTYIGHLLVQGDAREGLGKAKAKTDNL